MRIDRNHWVPANRWTFLIKPIAALLVEEMTPGLWVDPFAGMHSPATVQNDLNPASPAAYHMDALAFLRSQSSNYFDGGLYDPPYSFYQAKTVYEKHGANLQPEVLPTNMAYWARCKDEMARIVKPGGKVLCFGWTSMGLGSRRGFELTRILLVPHGGSRNDTICTVEDNRRRKDLKLNRPL